MLISIRLAHRGCEGTLHLAELQAPAEALLQNDRERRALKRKGASRRREFGYLKIKYFPYATIGGFCATPRVEAPNSKLRVLHERRFFFRSLTMQKIAVTIFEMPSGLVQSSLVSRYVCLLISLSLRVWAAP